MYTRYHEPKIEKIIDYKSRRIQITSEILHNIQQNRMMLLKNDLSPKNLKLYRDLTVKS